MPAIRPILSVLVLGLTCGLSMGCSPSTTVLVGDIKAAPAASWIGTEKEALDDGIDLTALATELPAVVEDLSDATIEARLGAAEGVVLSKVVAVSSEPVGEKNRYRLEFVPEGEILDGETPGNPFFLIIESASPAYGIIRAQDAKLVGKRFIVFFKRYANAEGDAVVMHFRLSGNHKRVLEGITRAKTRRAFK